MDFTNKRNLYIVVGVMTLILTILVVLTLVVGPKPQSQTGSSQTTDNGGGGAGNTALEGRVASEFPIGSPEYVALQFYNWYVNHKNPIGSGDYKKVPYLTEYYMEAFDSYRERGRHLQGDPVFNCLNIKPPKNVVAQDASFDQDGERAHVSIRENRELAKFIYQIILKREKGKWLVRDVWCP
jgi:hypothetical protein